MNQKTTTIPGGDFPAYLMKFENPTRDRAPIRAQPEYLRRAALSNEVEILVRAQERHAAQVRRVLRARG